MDGFPWQGPRPQSRDQRLALVATLVTALHRRYGAAVHAIALYGSCARQADAAYSDVELWCALDAPGLDESAEWVTGPGKAEVNLLGLDVLQEQARAVEADWALSQGRFVHLRPLHGDAAFFAELRCTVLSPDSTTVAEVVAEMVVGECYEWMGKLRNALLREDHRPIPALAIAFSEHVACMAGLLHRTVFAGGPLLSAAAALPDLPTGYLELARRVEQGDLTDSHATAAAIENLWAGLEPWLARHAVNLMPRTRWSWLAA